MSITDLTQTNFKTSKEINKELDNIFLNKVVKFSKYIWSKDPNWNLLISAVVRFLLFPFVPIFWIIELVLTPPECRIKFKGWMRLWLTGDCVVPEGCNYE